MTPTLLAAIEWDWNLDGWIVITAILSTTTCALLGNFLVLRRMSMMGDAISHAVLPGLAIAFLIFESRGSMVMFIGAVIAGVMTALFTQWISNLGKVDQSASMGVVFTSLFAVGLILIVRALDHVDLDPGCVLYGAIEAVPMQKTHVWGLNVPRAVTILAPMFLINAMFVLIFYKELKISSFDPALATTLGINATLMHYLLMTLVAATTVACFESVGSILVIAMLIVPAATAHLLTDRLHTMILTSMVVAILAAFGGHVSAITVPTWFGFSDTSTAGMMAVVAGTIFALTMFLAPQHGLISKIVHRAMLRMRIMREDVLGLLFRIEEWADSQQHDANLALVSNVVGIGPVLTQFVLRSLAYEGKIMRLDNTVRLTDRGRAEGTNLVRSHRLWESYLHKHLHLAPDHVHPTAEQLEHITDSPMQQKLAQTTNQPTIDPQGKRIP